MKILTGRTMTFNELLPILDKHTQSDGVLRDFAMFNCIVTDIPSWCPPLTFHQKDKPVAGYYDKTDFEVLGIKYFFTKKTENVRAEFCNFFSETQQPLTWQL